MSCAKLAEINFHGNESSPVWRGQATRSFHRKHDLAEHPARLQSLVALRGLLERQDAVDHRAQAAVFQARQREGREVGGQLGFLGAGTGAEDGAGDPQAPAQHLTEIDLDVRPAEEADEDEAALVAQSGQMAVDGATRAASSSSASS